MVEQFTLPNGLEVLMQEMPGKTTVAWLAVHAGTLNEKEGEEGIAHFVEHTLISNESQEKKFYSFPHSNLLTSHFNTRVVGDLNESEVPSFLDLASQIAFEPKFPSDKIELERQRILREIAEDNCEKQWKMEEYSLALLGSKTFNLPIKGTPDSVTRISQGQLRTFHRQHYGANNSTLILVGSIPKDIEKLVETHFSYVPKGLRTMKRYPEQPPFEGQHEFFHPRGNQRNEPDAPAYIKLGIRVPSIYSSEAAAILGLTFALGGSPASVLHQTLSNQQGLTYNVEARYEGKYANILEVKGEFPANKIDAAIDGIYSCFEKLKNQKIPQEELDTYTRRISHALLKEARYDTSIATELLQCVREEFTIALLPKTLSTLNAEQVLEAANKYLPGRRGTGNYALFVDDPLRTEAETKVNK